MKGYVTNLEKESKENTDFRRVLYTANHSQLVLMLLQPGEEIGEEVHELDQFIRVEKGEGKAILDGVEYEVGDGFAIVVPQGTRHNVVNTGAGEMKLYTVYSPPQHKDGVIHKTKAEAQSDDEHYTARQP